MATPAPAPPDILEIFLQPGEFYFGDEKTRIRTLLGSCVAIVLWHPKLRIGGMCHYMLPHSPRERHGQPLDGRYAEDAMHMFMRELGGPAPRRPITRSSSSAPARCSTTAPSPSATSTFPSATWRPGASSSSGTGSGCTATTWVDRGIET